MANLGSDYHAEPSWLLEPAPCDECWQRTRCAATGEACAAFARFQAGKPWAAAPRQPSKAVGLRLGLVGRPRLTT